MGQRLWMRDGMEGLFVRDLKNVLQVSHRAQLSALGLDLARLEPACSVETFRAAIEVVAPVVAPGKSAFEAQVELGRRFTRGYFDTLLGRTMSKAMAIVGPSRGITRIGRSFRSFTNYLDARLIETQIGSARVSFSPVEGLTGLLLGINQESGALLSRAGHTSDVKLISDDGTEAFFGFEWS